MELKRTVIFLGVIGLISLGSQLLFGAYLSQFSDEPATAKKICAENERLLQVEGLNDGLKPMSQTACRGAADARNGKPEQKNSVEYREGYLYGLKLKCFRDGQSISEMDECVDEWEVTAATYRRTHGMEAN
ncbi:MAG: hypothetical protein AAGL08_14260 [Cyanobacteria bacterium J06573_11]